MRFVGWVPLFVVSCMLPSFLQSAASAVAVLDVDGSATTLNSASPAAAAAASSTFDEEMAKARAFATFLGPILKKVDDFYVALVDGSHGDGQQQQQQQDPQSTLQNFIISTLLSSYEMNPELLTQSPLQENWLETVYNQTKAMAPTVFFSMWDETHQPTKQDVEILLAVDDTPKRSAQHLDPDTGKLLLDKDQMMNHLLEPFRHRGFIVGALATVSRILLAPFKSVSYAIPSSQNLELLARYAPLVEVGAGTGYWSAALQTSKHGGVDIIAFDAAPPERNGGDNLYFDQTYTTVHQGTCEAIFSKDIATATQETTTTNYADRTLLLVWPNNPDNVDNAKAFHSAALPPVWDTACAQAFVAAGGTTLILVAEREANIHILPPRGPHPPPPPDSGLCATRQFQTFLREHFELVEQQAVPSWYYNDDLTVWKRKETVVVAAGLEQEQ